MPGTGRHSGQCLVYDAPDDNGYGERIIRTLKEEESWPNSYESRLEAPAALEASAEYHNRHRIHSALASLTPDELAVT